MKITSIALISVILGISGISGCAMSTKTEPSTASAAVPSPATTPSNAESKKSKPSERKFDEKLVHFAFDSSVLSHADQKIVMENARFLLDHPTTKVRLEGHADERGTRAYNMALGERRGQAIARALRVLGVSGDRVEVVSYGKEKPVAQGHDESAWWQNRRGEFVYLQ